MNPPTTPVTLVQLVTPVKGSRLWTDALVPRADGGWNWIGQFYNDKDQHPTEWVVMNLETGERHHSFDFPYTPGTRGHQANSKFGISNQLRAPNGRVFFPAESAWWWYYDPETQTVVDGGRVPNSTDSLLYSMVFNHDGCMLYGGTLGNSDSSGLPEVLTIDPDTLVVTPLCRVGSAPVHTHNAYAYYLCADGDWLYVLVGEDVWEVVAVNLRTTTKTQTILKTAPANTTASFWKESEGMTVKLHKSGQIVDQFWIVEGKLYPYDENYIPADLPFPQGDTTPYTNPITAPPEIDESLCPGLLKWRPNQSTGASTEWTEMPFCITYPAPIPIESLLLLPDGSLLGDVEDYQGFFRFHPASGSLSVSGPFPGVTEGRSRLVVDGKAYISGYPNAPLWEYDPNIPFSTTGAQDTTWNPKRLGEYSDGFNLSAVKRSVTLAYSSKSDRLYMAGLRDRSGHGAGIGYYDRPSGQFAGVNADLLNFYGGGLGLVVFDNLNNNAGLVVFSGKIGANPDFPGQTPPFAELVLYDLDLNDMNEPQKIPVPGGFLLDTGYLFRTGEPTVVVGLSRSGKLLYRWDIVLGKLLKSVTLPSHVGIATQGPSGIITTVFDSTLVQIDPLTLEMTSLGTLADPNITCIVQSGHDLYVTIGADLYVIKGASA